jgi:hypothetical protein
LCAVADATGESALDYGLLRSLRTSSPIRPTPVGGWLTQAELVSGGWIDPEAGRVLLPVYAAASIDERPGLRPKTIQFYRYLMRAHLQEAFGSTTIAGITEADVRRWPADMEGYSGRRDVT